MPEVPVVPVINTFCDEYPQILRIHTSGGDVLSGNHGEMSNTKRSKWISPQYAREEIHYWYASRARGLRISSEVWERNF